VARNAQRLPISQRDTGRTAAETGVRPSLMRCPAQSGFMHRCPYGARKQWDYGRFQSCCSINMRKPLIRNALTR
jgi:hypothetical protein